MKSLFIVVELRKPQTKEEAALYGMCVTDRNLVSRVFINSLKAPRTRVDTFFHELTHALVSWRGNKWGRKEEKAARQVGIAANKAFNDALGV